MWYKGSDGLTFAHVGASFVKRVRGSQGPLLYDPGLLGKHALLLKLHLWNRISCIMVTGVPASSQ